MKKLILLSAVLFLLSCGTVHKVTGKLKVDRDSASNVSSKTLAVANRDSLVCKEDHSLIKTHEHIVNDIVQPADSITGSIKLSALKNHPRIIENADSSGWVEVGLYRGDTTIYFNAHQKAKTQHQVIDRDIQNQRNTTDEADTKTKSTVSTVSNARVKVHVGTVKKDTKKDKTGLSIPWYIEAGLPAFIIIAFLLFLFYKYYKLII